MIDKKTKEVMREAVIEAGSFAGDNSGKFEKLETKKGFTDLVTDIDKKCEEIVIKKISKSFPEDMFLAEESGSAGGEGPRRWIIDPVDGTTNFAHGFPFFCCSIALERDGKIIAGAVYEPSRKELFFAERSKGATLNGDQIKVSKNDTLSRALIATGFAYDNEGKLSNIDHFRKMLSLSQAVRRAGSAALDLCYVACGRLDGFWELGLAPWDTAAGALIVEESGGSVTQLSGEKYDIFKKSIAAGNSSIHAELIRVLGGKK